MTIKEYATRMTKAAIGYIVAIIHNMEIAVIQQAGYSNTAEASRWFAGHLDQAFALRLTIYSQLRESHSLLQLLALQIHLKNFEPAKKLNKCHRETAFSSWRSPRIRHSSHPRKSPGQGGDCHTPGKAPGVRNDDRTKNVFDSAVCKNGKLRT